jgi:hypothetical protein
MHIEEEYFHQVHIITKTITNWQPHNLLKIATPTLKLKAYQSGMRKAHVFVKAQSDAPTINFQP